MKIKSLCVAVLLMTGVSATPSSNAADETAWQIPTFKSLIATPNEIELTANNTKVVFRLTVSHPIGIASERTVLHVSNGNGIDIEAILYRISETTNSELKDVVFEGSIEFSRNIPAGSYSFSADGVAGYTINKNRNLAVGTPYFPQKVRSLVDAESSLLIRNNGYLNYDFNTFVGPNHDSPTKLRDNKPQKLNSSLPIWRVGETYDPKKYFELRTSDLNLQIKSESPQTCAVAANVLRFLSIGECTFKVFTQATMDYHYQEWGMSASIAGDRIKPTVLFDLIADQATTSLPQTIKRFEVYSSDGRLVLPISETPSICIANSFSIILYSGGKCTLSYKSEESTDFFASDIALQTFVVIDSSKPVATPTPIPTANPVVKKTITCAKGKKTIKKTGTNPKCPAGYKLKK
jgi:hypothetical protein